MQHPALLNDLTFKQTAPYYRLLRPESPCRREPPGFGNRDRFEFVGIFDGAAPVHSGRVTWAMLFTRRSSLTSLNSAYLE
jgi:hypothetical protein